MHKNNILKNGKKCIIAIIVIMIFSLLILYNVNNKEGNEILSNDEPKSLEIYSNIDSIENDIIVDNNVENNLDNISISFEKPSLNLLKGDGFALTSIINNENLVTKFESTNESVISINSSGYIKANDVGESVIKVYSDDGKIEIKVSVIEPIDLFETKDAKIGESTIIEANKELKYLPDWIVELIKNSEYKFYLTSEDISEYCNNEEVSGFAIGYTDVVKKEVYINRVYTSVSVMHELGHVFNDLMNNPCESDEFIEIYESEKENFKKLSINEHHYNFPQEYFAESFNKFFKFSYRLKEYCPRTYEYLYSFIYRN